MKSYKIPSGALSFNELALLTLNWCFINRFSHDRTACFMAFRPLVCIFVGARRRQEGRLAGEQVGKLAKRGRRRAADDEKRQRRRRRGGRNARRRFSRSPTLADEAPSAAGRSASPPVWESSARRCGGFCWPASVRAARGWHPSAGRR